MPIEQEASAGRDGPRLRDVGIMAFVPDLWDGPWQPRHQILFRLSEYFNVVWCDPAPWWRSYRSVSARDETVSSCPVRTPGLRIYHPEPWLPEVGRPQFVRDWTRRERLRRAHEMLRREGARRIVLYLWRPCYRPVLDLVRHDFSCYHIDDEYTFSEVELPLSESEAELIRRVDQVVVHSPALVEKKGNLNPRTLVVPNGVDYRAFTTPLREPDDLAVIPHPRIGYVGRIKRQLDLPLLISLARRHAAWSFVFVGPRGGMENCALLYELMRLPNVHFLGGKCLSALPAYTQHLDVCLLCYAVNDYTRFIYPLKLHEYLAGGRPVVGSPIRSLLQFDGVIRLARTVDQWSEALHESLEARASSSEQIEARRSVARQHDWGHLVGRIARSFCEGLGPEYLRRLDRMPPPDGPGVPATAVPSRSAAGGSTDGDKSPR